MNVFIANEQNRLQRFPAALDGLGSSLLSRAYLTSIVLDDRNVYAFSAQDRAIVYVPKEGGPTSVLAVFDAEAYGQALRISGEWLYFVSVVTSGGLEHQVSHCTLKRISVHGGAAAVLLQYDNCGELVVDDRAVYAIGASKLLEIPLDGSAPSTLFAFAADGDRISLAADDTHVWVAALHENRIFSIAKAGGAAISGLITAGLPFALSISGAELFWLEAAVGSAAGQARADVMTARKSGGPAHRLLADAIGAEATAVNADALYIAGLGPLHRIAR
jgi:hypothetical protein